MGNVHLHSLSSLYSSAPVSSLPNVKLDWKVNTLLALVNKCCFGLTLLCLDISTFFFTIMLLFLFLYLDVRQIN